MLLNELKLIKEDDDNWPKLISHADKYRVELHENEQVKLLSGNQVIATMPLVIWKQLTR